MPRPPPRGLYSCGHLYHAGFLAAQRQVHARAGTSGFCRGAKSRRLQGLAMTEHEIAVGEAYILERAHRAVEHVVARSRRRPRWPRTMGPSQRRNSRISAQAASSLDTLGAVTSTVRRACSWCSRWEPRIVERVQLPRRRNRVVRARPIAQGEAGGRGSVEGAQDLVVLEARGGGLAMTWPLAGRSPTSTPASRVTCGYRMALTESNKFRATPEGLETRAGLLGRRPSHRPYVDGSVVLRRRRLDEMLLMLLMAASAAARAYDSPDVTACP